MCLLFPNQKFLCKQLGLVSTDMTSFILPKKVKKTKQKPISLQTAINKTGFDTTFHSFPIFSVCQQKWKILGFFIFFTLFFQSSQILPFEKFDFYLHLFFLQMYFLFFAGFPFSLLSFITHPTLGVIGLIRQSDSKAWASVPSSNG